ncbi:MAG: DUF1015 domain-containing protein [Nitrospirae bacterium]|nr:DUF1015 domain-containing protein [Nitrospirota bacterium]
MAEIIPFKGVLYNPEKVDAGAVTAPPYDIVSPQAKDKLYEKSPHNIIRIDFGKDNEGDDENENRYSRASALLNDWLEKDILRQDSEPAFYCYEATYRVDGEERRLRGILGAVKIEELGSGEIHPHEETHSKPKSDRLNILRFCRANISPIFSIYSSAEKKASSILEKIVKNKPFLEAIDNDGFINRLWKINDKASIDAIRKEFSDKDIFIADGHHRYETALAFKHEMEQKGELKTGDEPFNYVLMFLANMDEPGLTLLPTHRMVEIDSSINITEILSHCFDIEAFSYNNDSEEKTAMDKMFHAMKTKKYSIGMFDKDEKKYYDLSFRCPHDSLDSHDILKKLDVTVLHKLIFREILKVTNYEYEMSPEVAVKRVKSSPARAAFFLSPTRVEDLKAVALEGQRMPPKSTYFYPKLLTGMVIFKF